ncbi:MAG TPA: hypothetical protein VMF13_14590 [Luteitalea sp.]|nr:hypothetical protein [Luteitalea sp.]
MSDLTSSSPSLHPHDAAATDSVHAAAASTAPARKPKDKVRSAWISFAGRIVAQLIGAAATVLLGVFVVQGYAGRARAAEPKPSAAAAANQPHVTAAQAGARRRGALVVLPFQDFSASTARDRFADALTEGLTAALARHGRLPVVSRTSAMHYKDTPEALPAIAAALDVAYVVEGSIVRQERRMRATVQLIDAGTDTHVWARTYDREGGDVLALEADLAHAIGVDVLAAVPVGTRARATAPAVAATADARTSNGQPPRLVDVR